MTLGKIPGYVKKILLISDYRMRKIDKYKIDKYETGEYKHLATFQKNF